MCLCISMYVAINIEVQLLEPMKRYDSESKYYIGQSVLSFTDC